ncbi:hypothetical protein QJQ45_019323, partial [Haematococcus lacustris]
ASSQLGLAQLGETLRRVGRAISLVPPDPSLVLEAGLRAAGLRDAPEAARAAACTFKLAAMQLPSRPQYQFDVGMVRSMLTVIQVHWLHGLRPASVGPPAIHPSRTLSPAQPSSKSRNQQATPPSRLGTHTPHNSPASSQTPIQASSASPPPNGLHPVPVPVSSSNSSSSQAAPHAPQTPPTNRPASTSGLSAVEHALRVVLLGCAPAEDRLLLSRLIDQATEVPPRSSAASCTDALATTTTTNPAQASPHRSQGQGRSRSPSQGASQDQGTAGSRSQADQELGQDWGVRAALNQGAARAHAWGLPPMPQLVAAMNSLITASHSSSSSMTGASGAGSGSRNGASVVREVSGAAAPGGVGPQHGPRGARRFSALPLASVHPDRLMAHVTSLAALLTSNGACIVVGPAGVGKSLVWRTLVAAVSGPGALDTSRHHSYPPQLLHLFPDALPLPSTCLPVCGTLHDPAGGSKGSEVGTPAHETWLQDLLEPLQSWQLRGERDAPSDAGISLTFGAAQTTPRNGHWQTGGGGMAGGGGLERASMRPSSLHPHSPAALSVEPAGCHPSWQADDSLCSWSAAAATPAASSLAPHRHKSDWPAANPQWVVLDGPLGTPAAEAMLPLVVCRAKAQQQGGGTGNQMLTGAGPRQQLALRAGTKVVWECDSLASASPSLMATIPVLSIQAEVLDTAGRAVHEAVLSAVRRALPSVRPSALFAFTKQANSLLNAVLERCSWILQGGSSQAPRPAAAAAIDTITAAGTLKPNGSRSIGSSHGASHGTEVTSKSGSGLLRATSVHASPSTPTAAAVGARVSSPELHDGWPGLEHGAVLYATAAYGCLALFAEVVAGLDLPSGSPVAASLLLARAAAFAYYWSVAALPLSSAQRSALEAALKEAAAATECSKALPWSGSVGGFLLGPRDGQWCPWPAALPTIMDARCNLVNPGIQGLTPEQLSALPPSATRWHLFADPLTGKTCLFVPNGMTVALQHVAALASRAGLHPLLLGPVGSGVNTLLRHLLASAEPWPQLRKDVVGLALHPLSQPTELNDLLSWRLVAGRPGHLRPTLGHQLVLLVNDLSMAVQATPTSASLLTHGSIPSLALGKGLDAEEGQGVAVSLPCLEWLRQVLNGRCMVGRLSGQPASLSLQGVSLMASSSPAYLMSGPQQASPR